MSKETLAVYKDDFGVDGVTGENDGDDAFDGGVVVDGSGLGESDGEADGVLPEGCLMAERSMAAVTLRNEIDLDMSSLPREIVDAIVDCIQTDRPSLSACLLTCDVKLAASSRRYLFRQVKIGPPGSRLSAKAFSDLVVAAPDILPLITTLHLKQGNFPFIFLTRIH